ncbi:uncharacterized protein LOC128743110 [Sabethes cyaneus]|uniref:uncharacterized protein LOC128743110 n=1 Tax=Sabethes cyaneus TaxID=53552 RepID=UPI00237E575A|nr:uncharacterized protein LOC128743110 [Sabethes cyaneus]
MVICTFFLNNSCRFGSKCINDHIDLSSVIKSEVDGTLKGNQWPLSCFGPFKGRTCVPNFIDDFSYEEIRMKYLEAKMQNNIAEHQMQLGRMITEAKQKMQWLATTNPSIMNILIELYNQQEDSLKPTVGQPSGVVNNPFATQMGNSAPGSTANIFGGGNAGGGFGTMNAFGNSGATTGGNIFGTSNILGGGTSSPSIGGNLFAKPAQTATAASPNVFALPNIGIQQPTNNVFGAPPVFGNNNTSLFSAVQKNPDSYSDSGGPMFGNASPVSAGNIFTQQAQSAFGPATAQNKNIFGNSSQTQQVAGTLFAPTPAPLNSNPFVNTPFGGTQTSSAQEQQNIFASAFTQQHAQQQSIQTNVFSQSTQQSASAGGLFVPAPQPTVAGTFAAPQQPAFQSGVPATAVSTTSGSGLIAPSVALYSRMEELNKNQLDAFKADAFELGKIPTVPPPRELCS